MSAHHNKPILGILLALLGAISLSAMGECVKYVGKDVPDGFILFARFFVSFLVLLPFVLQDKNFSFRVNNMKGLFARSIFGFIAMMCFFQTLKSMPAANAMLLINTAPIFVPLILYILTKTKTKKSVIFSIFISFIGVGIIIDPSSGVIQPSMIIGLTAGLFASVATVLLRVVGKQNTPNQMMFYYFLFCTLLGLAAGVYYWQPLSGVNWLAMLFVGIFGVLYQFGLTYALKYTQVRIVSPILLTAILYSGVFDWFIRGIMPGMKFSIGALVLIIGIIFVIIFSSTKKNTEQ